MGNNEAGNYGKKQTFQISKEPVVYGKSGEESNHDFHKYEVTLGEPVFGFPEVPPYEDLGSLPSSYGSRSLFLVARDPHWLFLYWDVDWEAYPISKTDGLVLLKIYNEDGTEIYSANVTPEAQNWYVPVSGASTSYYGELGYINLDGIWDVIARSNNAQTPSNSVSDEVSGSFATVPQHLAFQRLVDLVKGNVADGESLVEALSRIQGEGRSLMFVLGSAPFWTDEQRRMLATLLGNPLPEVLGLGTEELDSLLRKQLLERLFSESASGVLLATGGGSGESSLFSAFAAFGSWKEISSWTEVSESSLLSSWGGAVESSITSSWLASWGGARESEFWSSYLSSWGGASALSSWLVSYAGGQAALSSWLSSWSGPNEKALSSFLSSWGGIPALSSWLASWGGASESFWSSYLSSWGGARETLSSYLASWGAKEQILSSWLASWGGPGAVSSYLSSWAGGASESFWSSYLSSWPTAAGAQETAFWSSWLSSWSGAAGAFGSREFGASWSAQPFGVAPREFFMHVNAEVIFYGGTHPNAKVWIDGQPVPLKPDGTFRFHFKFPDGDYSIPIVAQSPDGLEQRASTLRFERNTARYGDVGSTAQPEFLTEPMGRRF